MVKTAHRRSSLPLQEQRVAIMTGLPVDGVLRMLKIDVRTAIVVTAWVWTRMTREGQQLASDDSASDVL
jgi:hypothetical protein